MRQAGSVLVHPWSRSVCARLWPYLRPGSRAYRISFNRLSRRRDSSNTASRRCRICSAPGQRTRRGRDHRAEPWDRIRRYN